MFAPWIQFIRVNAHGKWVFDCHGATAYSGTNHIAAIAHKMDEGNPRKSFSDGFRMTANKAIDLAIDPRRDMAHTGKYFLFAESQHISICIFGVVMRSCVRKKIFKDRLVKDVRSSDLIEQVCQKGCAGATKTQDEKEFPMANPLFQLVLSNPGG